MFLPHSSYGLNMSTGKRKHRKSKRSHYIKLHKQISSDICVYLSLERLPYMETWRSRLCIWVWDPCWLHTGGSVCCEAWGLRGNQGNLRGRLRGYYYSQGISKNIQTFAQTKNNTFLDLVYAHLWLKTHLFWFALYISNTFGGSESVWRLSCLLHFQLPVRFVLFGQQWALSFFPKIMRNQIAK